MTKVDFNKFLEQKARATTEAPAVDWSARKRDWLDNLAKFHSIVEGYLAEFLDSGKVRLEKCKISLVEEHLGQYEADSMTIFLGSDKVTLAPIGAIIIGARGRVDMTGPAGTAKFILTEKNFNGFRVSIADKDQTARDVSAETATPEDFVWKLATPPPNIRFIELRQESFFSALMEVVNG